MSTDMGGAPLLSLRGVSFEYRLKGTTFQALKDIDLEIRRGEFVAIIGASGSGKSTLMNLLGVMATPSAGSVVLDGTNLEHLDDDAQAHVRNEKVGFIFQQFHLLPKLSVLDNVLLPGEYAEPSASAPGSSVDPETRADREARAMALLSEFGLSDHALKRPAALSGGQKQRVAVCRALLRDPALILADEPTGALDSVNSMRVLDILAALHARGKTIVVITHDHTVAARVHRVVRMSDGRIVSDTKARPTPDPGGGTDSTDSTDTQGNVDAFHPTLATMRPEGSDRLPHAHRTAGARALAALTSPMRTLVKSAALSLQSVLSHRVRSALTIFGLMIGVSSIIIMLTLTGEARKAFKRFFDTKGGNTASVSFDFRAAERSGAPRWRGLHVQHDFARLNASFSKYGRISPTVEESGCSVRSATRTLVHYVEGVSSLAEFRDFELALDKGRYFAPHEMESVNDGRVVILGSDAAAKLFPPLDPGHASNPSYPLGQPLHVKGCGFEGSLRVVGILSPQDTTFDSEVNSYLKVPTRALLGNGLSPYRTRMTVVPNAGVRPAWLAESVRNALRLRTGDQFPFRTFVPEQQIAKIDMMLNVLGALTVVIGGLCTIIGGIGVMNIMLVNITERIKEIGIRKAVGARAFRIRNQFLIETVCLCGFSGILGVVSGLVVCNAAVLVAARALPRFLDASFVWDGFAVALALGSSLVAGVTFGLLPAKRAASMDIIDALRQE